MVFLLISYCKNTSDAFTGVLEENGIQISMDGIGRCKDNIIVERTWRTLKYEWVFLREYGSIEEMEGSLGEFVEFFNSRRSAIKAAHAV